MRRIESLTAVALVGLLVVAGWMYTRTEAAATLTAEDRAEITQLYATMYQGSDFRDADLWLSAFAEDGVFIFPTGDRVEGHEALMGWRKQSFGGETGDSKRRHHVPNIRILQAPDGGATASAYWIELDVAATPAAIKNTGTAEDIFVKTADGWKFKSHTVNVDGFGN